MSEARWIYREVLSALMARQGISATALAEATHVHRSTISRLRSGAQPSVSPELARAIADTLRVGIDTISADADDVIVLHRPMAGRAL